MVLIMDFVDQHMGLIIRTHQVLMFYVYMAPPLLLLVQGLGLGLVWVH